MQFSNGSQFHSYSVMISQAWRIIIAGSFLRSRPIWSAVTRTPSCVFIPRQSQVIRVNLISMQKGADNRIAASSRDGESVWSRIDLYHFSFRVSLLEKCSLGIDVLHLINCVRGLINAKDDMKFYRGPQMEPWHIRHETLSGV